MNIKESINKYKSEKNVNNVDLKKYLSLRNLGDDLKKVADEILMDKYNIPLYGYTSDLFTEDITNKSALRLVHGLIFIYPLVYGYKITNEKKYLLKGIDICNEWILKFRINKMDSRNMAFHDETTALRINYLIYFFDNCLDAIETDKLENLYKEIKETAQLLSTDSFYTINTNHGFFQDLSLIMYSRYFIYDEDSKKYYTCAKNRIKDYLNYIYTTTGVHQENSPEYHFIMANKIKNLAQDVSYYDEEFSNYLKEIYKNSCTYSSYIIMPNGNLPILGDTQNNLNVAHCKDPGYKDKNYLNIIKQNYTCVDLPTDYIDNEAGYAILRNKWDKNMIYILFSASYNTCNHKHCDDLSFILYYKQSIISESGPYGYGGNIKYRDYGYSSFAHNSLIVNNKGVKLYDKKFDKVKIIDYNINDKESNVVGINGRYEDVIHTRKLNLDKEELYITVEDLVESEKINDYIFLYHLAPHLSIKKEENTMHIYDKEKEICRMDFEGECKFKLGYEYGDNNKNIKGINFPIMYSYDFNYVIYVEIQQYKTIKLTTKIHLF